MTNRFHLTLDSIGTRIVAIAMFAYLATNTWHFIGTFIPADTIWHQPVMFVFFEGGLLYWFNRLEHASENVAKTIIAAFMTLVQLGAVMFATVYELSLGLQQKMHIDMSSQITNALPFVVTGLIMLWIIAWALGRMANEHFSYRLKHIAKHGVSPHLVEMGQVRIVQGSGKALEDKRQPLQVAAPKQVSGTGWRARLGNRLASIGAAFQANGEPISLMSNEDGAQDAEAEAEPMLHTSDYAVAQAEYSMAPAKAQAAARARPSGNASGRASRRQGDMAAILDALEQAKPGRTDAQLARLAGCAQSTVSRWRNNK